MRKLIAGGMSAALASLVLASAAVAAPHHPTGDFAQFANCPLSQPNLNDCFYQVSPEGSVTIGNRTVPITKPVTIQGGFEGGGSDLKFFGAEDGNTMSKTPQPIPGGLFGRNPPSWWPKAVKDRFNNLVRLGFGGATAMLELAAPATSIKLNTENFLFEEGIAVEIPVKVKLENRLLGNNCYVGSTANPMILRFTTGLTSPPPPNQPMHGTAGTISFNETGILAIISGARLVDNSLAIPKVSGCGGALAPFVDPLVNSLMGLPSPAGRNTAILDTMFLDAPAGSVRESEA